MKAFIGINARFYAQQNSTGKFDVFDRLNQISIPRRIPNEKRDRKIFSNGSEQECREFVSRNFVEPEPLSEGPWKAWTNDINNPTGYGVTDAKGTIIVHQCTRTDSTAISTLPKLLAFLRQYNAMFPSPEAAQALLEAEGWKL